MPSKHSAGKREMAAAVDEVTFHGMSEAQKKKEQPPPPQQKQPPPPQQQQ